MREGLWAVFVLLVSLVLQVQATYTSSEYYRGGVCPFRAGVGGSFTAPELSPIAGVPDTDPNFVSYLWQQLCKGMCHKPFKPLSNDDDIVNMLELNTKFQCENRDVKLDGDDILTSWNAQVEKPVCEAVGGTVVCIVNTVHKSIYVNIFLLTCAVEHKVFVVSPAETFGVFQCNLKQNRYATVVHDVFAVNFLSNSETNAKKSSRPKLVFATEDLAKEVVAIQSLMHDMPATKNIQEYNHDLLKKWSQVCGENNGHNTTAVCKSLTVEMAKVCNRVRTDKDNEQIAGIQQCVNMHYKGLEMSTRVAEAPNYYCGLRKWEMHKEMTECVNSNSNPMTPNQDSGPLAFIARIAACIFYVGHAVLDFFFTVYRIVNFVCTWFAFVELYIGLFIPPCIYVVANFKGWKFKGTFSDLIMCIIANSLPVSDGYTKCNSLWDVFRTSIFIACYALPYVVFIFLFCVMNFFLSLIGFDTHSIAELKESLRQVRSGYDQLDKGLQNVQTLETSVNSMDKRHDVLQKQLEQLKHQVITQHQATRPEMHGLRVNEPMRRPRDIEDAKRQGMREAHSAGLDGLKLEMARMADAAKRVSREELHAQEERARPIGENPEFMLKLGNKTRLEAPSEFIGKK